MKFKITNRGVNVVCMAIAAIATFIGGIYAQNEQMERLEEIDREYHENKDTEVSEEEV